MLDWPSLQRFLSDMDSDSDGDPFEGFDIVGGGDDGGGDDGDVPDFPDNVSDISVSTVNSDDLDDFDLDNDDEGAAGGAGPEEVLVNAEFSNNLRHVTVNDFLLDIGPNHQLNHKAKEIDYFNLLFTPWIFNHMVTETNRYAAQQQELNGRIDPNWTNTTEEELRAYVGINIWMGIHILPQTHMYWSGDDFVGVPGIIKTMTCDRYNKLTQYLHISNNEHQAARGERGYDPLYKIREVMEALDTSFRGHYRPHREMSIDEAMVAFKGRSFIKQWTSIKYH